MKREVALGASLGLLGTICATGVAMVAGPTSHDIDMSVSTALAGKDVTRAVPRPVDEPWSIPRTQPAAMSRVATGSAGVRLDARWASGASRSDARVQLGQQVTETEAKLRKTAMDKVAEQVRAEATDASAAAREESIKVDHERVKAEMERIAEEKRLAAKKLAEAKVAAARASASASATPTSGQTPVPTANVPVTETGGVSPIAPGHYYVGAWWGKYGSWSRWHTGQDLPAPLGTDVVAPLDGVASTTCAGCQGWAGDSVVVLHHADGTSTLYAHLSDSTVAPGQVVKAGQVIGHVGLKGRTFGPHLHFEHYPVGVVPGDVYSTDNPVTWLMGKGVRL